MKLIERVVYSIIGKPIKSLLLGLVVLLLGTFLSASFSIYQANVNLERNVRKSLNPVVLIEWNEDQTTDIETEKQQIINDFKSCINYHL